MAIERGSYVRLHGAVYEGYDGEVGRVYGQISPYKGQKAWAVEMRGTMVICALEKDMSEEEPTKVKRMTRWGARKGGKA